MKKEILDRLIAIMVKRYPSLSETIYYKNLKKELTQEDEEYIVSVLNDLRNYIPFPPFQCIAKLTKKAKCWLVEFVEKDFEVQLGFSTRGYELSSDYVINIMSNKSNGAQKLMCLLSDVLIEKMQEEDKILCIRIGNHIIPMNKDDIQFTVNLPECEEYEIIMTTNGGKSDENI